MKKSNFTGWKDVFRFAFIQDMKNKGTMIFTVILFVVAALALPVISLINGDENKEIKKSPIKKVYFLNESGIDIVDALKEVNKDTIFDEVTYEEVSDMKETEKKLDSDEDSKKAILMRFSTNTEEGCYDIQLEYSEKGKLDEEDINEFSNIINEKFPKLMSLSLGITDEQMDFVNMQVITGVVDYTGEDASDEEVKLLGSMQYNLLLTLISVMAFVVSITGSSVATSIITEKSSKIIEFLLTSIKPMAIVMGKVLATICVVLVEILTSLVGVLISFVINSSIKGISIQESIKETIGSFLSTEALADVSMINIIAGIIAICLALMLYGMMAGLVGATVSKLEEAAEGLKAYNFIMIIGCYIALGVAMYGATGGLDDTMIRIVCMFPLSAPFALPGFALVGMIDIVSILISIVILIVCIVLFTIFTANVYEEVIYHNGEPLKFKEIVKIYKNNKGGKR